MVYYTCFRKNEITQHTPFIFLTAKTEKVTSEREWKWVRMITSPNRLKMELLNAIEVRLKKLAVLDNKYSASAQGVSQFIKDVKDTGLMNKLADQVQILTLSKKQHLYQEGKRPRFLYYLVKGKIKRF